MATFEVRNPGSNLIISDLAQIVTAGETVDLLPLHGALEISNSVSLKTHLQAGTLIRVRGGGDVSFSQAYDDLYLTQQAPQISASVALSEAENAYSEAVLDSGARSMARRADSIGRIFPTSSLAVRGESIARRAESQALLDNSIADRAESLAKDMLSFANNNSIGDVTQIQFDINYTDNGVYPPHQEGLLFYDNVNHTLGLYNDSNQVMLQIGQELFVRVRNESGSPIANGVPVYFSGVHAPSGNLPTIELAQADDHATAYVFGITTQDFANNTNGYITIKGLVRGVNTSAYTAGTQLYLSHTVAGGYATSYPPAPNHKVLCGIVTVQDAIDGEILVTIRNGRHLSDITDVNGTIPSEGYILQYNASFAYWDAQPDPSSIARSIAEVADSTADYAMSLARTFDLSAVSVAASEAENAEDRASEATSIAERAASLARVAVETSDISEAASIGQDARSIALLAESEADYTISIARANESQAILDNSLADYGINKASEARSIALLASEAASEAESTANISTDYDHITFTVNPLFNGPINLLGWHELSDTGQALTSASPVTATNEGYNSHTVVNVAIAVGLPFTIRVTGNTVDETTGTVTVDDTEDLSITANGYYQTNKRFLDTPTISIVEAGKSCTIDIYHTTYWDRSNTDYTVEGIRFEWTPDSQNWDVSLGLYYVNNDGSLSIIDEIIFDNGDTYPRAGTGKTGVYKRLDYNTPVSGSQKEGIVVKLLDQNNLGSTFIEVKISL